jgi:multiple sugar transport system substrate-binding protein
MQRFAALYNKDTPKADVNNGYPEMVAEFDNGQVGMMEHNLGSLPNHQKAIPGKFAATELPAAADGKHYVVPDVVTTLGLFSQSKHQDADWKLMQFLDSHAEDSYWNKIVGQIPGNTDVESDAWVAATPSTANAIRVLTAPDTVVVPAPMYLPDFGSIVQTDMVPSWQKVLLGTMSAPDFAKQMADAFTAAYQDYKKHNP